MQTTNTAPSQGTTEIKGQLEALSRRARDEIGHITEPRAQALLETTAEVLDGLAVAYRDYAKGAEPAWRR